MQDQYTPKVTKHQQPNLEINNIFVSMDMIFPLKAYDAGISSPAPQKCTVLDAPNSKHVESMFYDPNS